MIKLAVACLFVAATALGQPSIAVHLGMSMPVSDFPRFTPRDYWPVGFSAGARGELSLVKWLQLAPGLVYNLYHFKGYHEEVSIDTRTPISSSGGPFQQLALNLNLRILTPPDTTNIRAYLLWGGTYLIQQPGRVTVQWLDQSGSLYSTTGSVERQRTWLYALGFGMVLKVSPHITIEPSFILHFNDKDWEYDVVNVNATYTFAL